MHPPGESMGSIYRIRNLCQGLTELSHECYIFTPFKYSEDWGPLVKFISIPVVSSKEGPGITKLIYKVIRKILDIRILSNLIVLNSLFFNFTIYRTSNALFNTIKANSLNLDVIIGETEIGGLMVNQIKEKLNFPVIVDYQNFWPEELVEHKIIKRNKRRYKRFLEMEKKIIEKADLIITPSFALKNFLVKYFTRNDDSKIKTVINGGLPVLEKPKTKYFPPKIINAGMIVHRSNIELFIQSLPYIIKKYPDIEIYLTKKGEKLNEIVKLAKKLKIKINFYWKENYKEFLDFLSTFHVGIVTSTNELTRQLGFVTKIYDYFSVGIPVVGNNIGGWTSIITEEKVGLLTENDPKDLAEKIIYFIENPEISYKYGERGIEILKNKYNIKNSAQTLIEYIESI